MDKAALAARLVPADKGAAVERAVKAAGSVALAASAVEEAGLVAVPAAQVAAGLEVPGDWGVEPVVPAAPARLAADDANVQLAAP